MGLETLVPTPDQTALIATTAPIYERVARDIARGYFNALQVVDQNPAIAAPMLVALKGSEAPEAAVKYAFYNQMLRPSDMGSEEMPHFQRALGFWLRRSVDGTRPEFEAGLRRMLRAYDPQFLVKYDANPSAP